MTRVSKQEERRATSPRRTKKPVKKTGSKKDNLPMGFKPHENAVPQELANSFFVPKIKNKSK